MGERRKTRRVRPDSLIGSVRNSVPARIVDMSPEGLQIEVVSALRPGARCDVSVPLDDDRCLRVRAEVRRCRAAGLTENDSGQAMMYRAGLELVDLAPGDAELLDRLCRDIAPTGAEAADDGAGEDAAKDDTAENVAWPDEDTAVSARSPAEPPKRRNGPIRIKISSDALRHAAERALEKE